MYLHRKTTNEQTIMTACIHRGGVSRSNDRDPKTPPPLLPFSHFPPPGLILLKMEVVSFA